MGKPLNITSLALRCALLVLFLQDASLVFAQNYGDPGLGREPVVSYPQDYKPLGVRAGTFMLHPGVQLATEWTDNVYYSEIFLEDDTIFHVRPYITAQSTWNRHSLNIRAAADFASYKDYDVLDYEDYFFNLNGRVDVRDRSFFSYQADFMRLHQGRNSRSSEQGIEPTVYYLTGGGVGYDHVFNRLSLGVHYNYIHLDYDDVVRLDGQIIDNQDQDRSDNIFKVRAGYQFQTDKQAFVSVTFRNTDYDQRYDRYGYARSGDGYSINAGLNFTVTGVLTGDVFISYLNRDYDDPRLSATDGWALGASLQWEPTTLTSVRASIVNSTEETTLQDSSGYLRNLYALRVDHELRRNLLLSGRISYSDNDYTLLAGAPTYARSSDKIWHGNIGMSYFFNRSISLSASYDYQKLNTNVPLDGYKVNSFWLVLGLER